MRPVCKIERQRYNSVVEPRCLYYYRDCVYKIEHYSELNFRDTWITGSVEGAPYSMLGLIGKPATEKDYLEWKEQEKILALGKEIHNLDLTF